jgi:hypothetical protein
MFRDYLTFETILNNLRSWTISRTYSSTGALDAESFSKLINGTEQIIEMTYSFVLSFFTSASTFFARYESVVLSPKSEKSDIITSKVLSMLFH